MLWFLAWMIASFFTAFFASRFAGWRNGVVDAAAAQYLHELEIEAAYEAIGDSLNRVHDPENFGPILISEQLDQ